jgi:hypothetical protein
MVKIILRLIQRLSPPANDELNSTLEGQHEAGHQFSPNCLQNQKFSDSNEIQSLKEKLELAINERLNCSCKKKSPNLENVCRSWYRASLMYRFRYTNKMQRYTVFFIAVVVLHVSGRG